MKGFYVYQSGIGLDKVTIAFDLSRVVSIVHDTGMESNSFLVYLAGDDAVYTVPAAQFLAHIYDQDTDLYNDLLAQLKPTH